MFEVLTEKPAGGPVIAVPAVVTSESEDESVAAIWSTWVCACTSVWSRSLMSAAIWPEDMTLLATASMEAPFGSLIASEPTPFSLYNTNPSQNGVGSLAIKLPNGASIDAVANNVISSGQIAADIKLRDQTLVQAQTQVDQMAATLSSSLSDVTTAGTAITGPPAGFSVSTSNMLPGNTINRSEEHTSELQHQVSIVNVTDPAALPLQNGANANPLLVGVDLTQPMATIVAQLNTALGANGLSFSGSGSTLNVVGSSAATVNAASSTITSQTVASGIPQFALFTDGNSLYSGQYTKNGSEMVGLAGRISINPAVI